MRMTESASASFTARERKTPWDKLDVDIQYKIVLDLEADKKKSAICREYDLSRHSVDKIEMNSDKIKRKVSTSARREGKRKHMMDETPPKLVAQTSLPEQNSPIPYRPRARGRPRRGSTNFTATPTSGTSVTIRMNSSSLVFPSPNVTPKMSSTKNKGAAGPGPSKKYNSKNKNAKPATVTTESSDLEEVTPDTPLRPSGKTADWDDFLADGNSLYFIPPVTMFKHAPLADIWKEFAMVGRVFEVPNPFVRCSRPVNWIATVVHFAGYKALIEFECLGVTPKFMSWMSFCSDIPKPIGWSDKNRIVLHPPHEVRAEYPDFLARAREALWSSKRVTIAGTHGDDVYADLKRCQKYALNTKLEVLDKTNVSRMRIATVTALVGDRIHVTYVIEPVPNDVGFWFNVNSDQIHPIGWSQTVEHEIYGVPKSAKFSPLSLDYFPKYPDEIKLVRGQLLEVRHPNQPRSICAAVVNRVLKHGYFVVEIKVLPTEVKAPTKFTYHVTSPYVYYCGFCEKHGIKILPPYGESTDFFNWDDYVRRLNLMKAPLDLLPARPSHSFKPGYKVEGIDITQPSYLGPCTILNTAAHMLYIHFDGWKRESLVVQAEAWFDAESPDIYPIGFAEMVGHEFQGCVEPLSPSQLALCNGTVEDGVDVEEPDVDEASNMTNILGQANI